MAKEFTGGGDPKRSIELLWGLGDRARRGPKPKLSVEDLVRAAIALADAEGLAALSMRRVAESLGVSPMSLYTYVPSKSELVDLMFDRVLAEVPNPPPELVGWRPKLAHIARQRWALSQRHPWLLELALHRPPLGPNVMSKLEVTLAAFDDMGLTESEMELMADVLHNYVSGALQAAREARELEQQSGLTDEEWISIAEPALEQHLEPSRFPAVRRLGDALRGAGQALSNPTERFDFGLERMLDGIEAFISARKQV